MSDITLFNAVPTVRPVTPVLPARPLPADAGGVVIREAVEGDLPFIDDLQKRCSKSLGFMTRATLEGKLRLGDVVIAEEVERDKGTEGQRDQGSEGSPSPWSLSPSVPQSLPRRVGYCIASDRYYKREDVGVIYQVNVAVGRQRGLVGAALVRGVFERWPYGVRLACCWCAQDLEANRFWESLGFVPLAYRGGSRKKSRLHILWQRRVRQGVACDWWYPSQTTGGMMSEDRLVLPIPPGVQWSEVKRVLLPGETVAALPRPARKAKPKPARPTPVKLDPHDIASGGFRFETIEPAPEPAPTPKAAPVPKPKNDPVLIRKVRELRDHYLERVNRDGLLASGGKYDVARALPGLTLSEEPPLRLAA